jgi:exopolyphosphatase/guanosine-5'-triphosphate,3'-diphosphate pyrophosphatase
MTAADRAELEGVSSDRSQQLVAGALVAEASMRALSLDSIEICPWALREGLILRKLDTESNGGPVEVPPVASVARAESA